MLSWRWRSAGDKVEGNGKNENKKHAGGAR